MSRDSDSYLAHVDGLRAIAVIFVVGYHVGLPGFAGGFIGVDVFFVISGFLIIGQIAKQLDSGSFSFSGFFARRVVRLLPLLLVVVLVTCIAGFFILASPGEYADFGKSAVAAAFMASNHYFLATQGYFDTAADTKPLLHTWSLGVEAQFYLVAPVIMWLCWKIKRTATGRAIPLIALALAGLSLAGCLRYTSAEHNAAFFMMPFRAWEFLAGAAALGLLPWTRTWRAGALNAMGLAGLALVVWSAAGYASGLAYPSWRPVLPVAGAMLLLAAGSASPEALTRKILSAKPLVVIGLLSYGWYLWHWPLLAYSRLSSFGHSSLTMDFMLAAVVGFGLAALTYAVIERPVARMKGVLVQRLSWATNIGGLVVAIAVATPGAYLWLAHAPRVTAGIDAVQWPTKTPLDSDSDKCVFRDHVELSSACDISSTSASMRGILVGDSHARESYKVLAALAAKAGVALVTMPMPGCPPLFRTDVLYAGQVQGCIDIWKKNRETLITRNAKLDYAIVQASWSIYLGGANGHRPPRLLIKEGRISAEPNQYLALQEGLHETIATLKSMGVNRILIVAPSPQFELNIPECLLRAKGLGLAPDICSRKRESIEIQRQKTWDALEATSKNSSGIRVIDPFTVFCNASVCTPHVMGQPMYVDDNHLSQAGTARLFMNYRKDLSWVFGGRLR